jgi:FAD/FMN-containing dehydrogenase
MTTAGPDMSRNWASNVVYGPSRVVAPRSVDELAEVVRSADRV